MINRYTMNKITGFGIFFLLIMMSCRSTKKLQTAINKKDTVAITQVDTDSLKLIRDAMDDIHKHYIDFKTFSAKIKLQYEDSKGKQPDVNAFVRIKKDSLIWISGYATVFNIEAFRVLINKDSVFVLDKINKELLKSNNRLGEFAYASSHDLQAPLRKISV